MSQNLSCHERAWVMGKLHSVISKYFAHWEDALFPKEQLDDVFLSYLQEAIETDSRDQLVLIIRRWIGQLRNAHSWCRDSEYHSGTRLGFHLEHMDDGWVVVNSEISEVSVGDVIESIDGKSPDDYMKMAQPYITAKSKRSRQDQWQHVLPYFWNSNQATLHVQNKHNRLEKIRYTPIKLATVDPNNLETQHPSGKWVKENTVGYIRIPSFLRPHFEKEALKYVQQFAKAQAIVVDLRSNGGGNTPSQLMQAMMDRPYRWWTERCPDVGYLVRRHGGHSQINVFSDGSGAEFRSEWYAAEAPMFSGKLIILTSRYTGSSAEDFSMPFKDNGRAILVGELTGGSTGQPVMFDYKGIHVAVGAIRAYMPDGSSFEGIGIQPDIEVLRTRDDLYTRRDRVLEHALELFR